MLLDIYKIAPEITEDEEFATVKVSMIDTRPNAGRRRAKTEGKGRASYTKPLLPATKKNK